jgi:hypothetical protein
MHVLGLSILLHNMAAKLAPQLGGHNITDMPLYCCAMQDMHLGSP